MNIPPQLQEILDGLPETVRRTIHESGYENVVGELVQTHSLTAPQARLLELETLFVLAGLESAADFAESIERESELPHETARAIANDVGLRVFSPFREKLQALTTTKEESGAATELVSQKDTPDHPQYKGGDPYREPIE